MAFIKRIINKFNEFSVSQKLIMFLVASVFAGVYVTVMCALLVFIYIVVNGEIVSIVRDTPGSKLLLAFSVLAVSTSAVYASIKEVVVSVGIAMALFILLFIRREMTKKLFDLLVDIAIAASVTSFAIALMQYLAADEAGRYSSVFFNANYYATIIEVVVPFAVYRIFSIRSLRRRVFYIGVILINLLGLLTCECRTTMVALCIVVPLLVIAFNKKYWWFVLPFLGVIVAMIALDSAMIARLTFQDLSGDLNIRQSIWMTAIKGILDKPIFGNGSLAYSRLASVYGGYPAKHAHNIFLELQLNYGLVGGCLCAAYASVNLKEIISSYQKNRQRCILACAISLGMMMHGMVDATLFWPQTGILAAVVFGAGCAGDGNTLKKVIINTQGAKVSHKRAV